MVTIIISAKGKLQGLTIPCIQGVHATVKVPYELMGIDDGSKDGTYEYMQQNCHKAIRLGGVGVGTTRNVGLTYAAGDHILFLDNDIVLNRPGWLGAMLSGFGRSNVGVVGPILSNEAQWRSAYPKSPDGLVDVFAVAGACFLFPRSTFDRLGMLDPKFSRRGEDTDYCFRAKLSGLRVVITPGVLIEHKSHGTYDWRKEKGQLRKFRQKYKHLTHVFPVP